MQYRQYDVDTPVSVTPSPNFHRVEQPLHPTHRASTFLEFHWGVISYLLLG